MERQPLLPRELEQLLPEAQPQLVASRQLPAPRLLSVLLRAWLLSWQGRRLRGRRYQSLLDHPAQLVEPCLTPRPIERRKRLGRIVHGLEARQSFRLFESAVVKDQREH